MLALFIRFFHVLCLYSVYCIFATVAGSGLVVPIASHPPPSLDTIRSYDLRINIILSDRPNVGIADVIHDTDLSTHL